MRNFSGLEYLKIDIANQYDMDKTTWDIRLAWFNEHIQNDFSNVIPKHKFMAAKAIQAYKDSINGIPSSHIMYLDATNSGLSVMAALSGCKDTALATNMIDPDNRRDSYGLIVEKMNKELPKLEQVDRDKMKLPVMTFFYGKVMQDTLSDTQEDIFYDVLEDTFPGATLVHELFTNSWNSKVKYYQLTAPDGHVAYILITEMVDYKIEVDELDHASFIHRIEINKANKYGISISANVTHFVDAFIAREVIRRCNTVGIQVITIHDAFGCSPIYMNQVRQVYKDILIEVADSNLMQDILDQLGNKFRFKKLCNNLGYLMGDSEYMLS